MLTVTEKNLKLLKKKKGQGKLAAPRMVLLEPPRVGYDVALLTRFWGSGCDDVCFLSAGAEPHFSPSQVT